MKERTTCSLAIYVQPCIGCVEEQSTDNLETGMHADRLCAYTYTSPRTMPHDTLLTTGFSLLPSVAFVPLYLYSHSVFLSADWQEYEKSQLNRNPFLSLKPPREAGEATHDVNERTNFTCKATNEKPTIFGGVLAPSNIAALTPPLSFYSPHA